MVSTPREQLTMPTDVVGKVISSPKLRERLGRPHAGLWCEPCKTAHREYFFSSYVRAHFSKMLCASPLFVSFSKELCKPLLCASTLFENGNNRKGNEGKSERLSATNLRNIILEVLHWYGVGLYGDVPPWVAHVDSSV